MFIERNPRRVAEDLHSATLIPCSAFTGNGRLLYSGGSHFCHDDYDLYNRLVEEMVHPAPPISQYRTLTSAFGDHYTAYYINKHRPADGFVLLGPYTPADLERISRFEICFYNNQTPDPVGPRLLKCSDRSGQACYSLPVRKAIDLIHARYREELPLDRLVEHLKLNKSYFCTLFKKETGQTFTAYLNQVRVEKSKRCLIREDRSILEIALSVGFSSQNYFTIIFRRVTGLTPAQFRRQGLSGRV